MKYVKPKRETVEMLDLVCLRLRALGVNASVMTDMLIIRSVAPEPYDAIQFTYWGGAMNAVELQHHVMKELLENCPQPAHLRAGTDVV